MKLFKSSIISVFTMYLLTVGTFWLFGVGNELQVAVTIGAAAVGGLVLPVAYLVWGLPAHLLMQKAGVRSVVIYAIIGAIPGAAFVTIFKPFGFDSFGYLVLQSIFCGSIGAAGALTLWYLQVHRNA